MKSENEGEGNLARLQDRLNVLGLESEIYLGPRYLCDLEPSLTLPEPQVHHWPNTFRTSLKELR
jgi:hypothetical protein